jgi:hypothetical protein
MRNMLKTNEKVETISKEKIKNIKKNYVENLEIK